MQTNLRDYSEASVMLKPLIVKLENELEKKDFVQAFATLVELRNYTTELKSWLMVEIGRDNV